MSPTTGMADVEAVAMAATILLAGWVVLPLVGAAGLWRRYWLRRYRGFASTN